MVTIQKSSKKGQFFVRAKSGKNILHSSETLTSRANCFKNVIGTMKLSIAIFEGAKPVVDDNGAKYFYNKEKKKFIKEVKAK